MLFNYVCSFYFSDERNWLQGKVHGSSWCHLCQLELGSTRDFKMLKPLPGRCDLGIRASLLTAPGSFLSAPWQLGFAEE